MSVQIGISVLVIAVLYVIVKGEIQEIVTWWKQEKKFNKKRRWS